jgi:hypothetical protein
MKKTTALFFAFVMIFQFGYANGILKSTSTISVKNTEKIDSENSKRTYDFVVSQNIKDANGTILIAEGAPVKVDLRVESKRSLGKSGEIRVNLISVKAVDGQEVFMTGEVKDNPKDHKGKVLGISLGIGLTLLWPMLLYMLKKGETATLNSNTTITGKPIMDYNIQ